MSVLLYNTEEKAFIGSAKVEESGSSSSDTVLLQNILIEQKYLDDELPSPSGPITKFSQLSAIDWIFPLSWVRIC